MTRGHQKLLTGILILSILAAGFLIFVIKKQRGPTPFRIAFNTWVGYGPFYVAKEKGFFKEEGLDVRLERIEGTGERRGALIARRIEALGTTIDDLVVGASQGVPATMILAIDESTGADGIVAVNTIRGITDLRGKTVAVQPGFVNHFFLLYVLDKAGLSPDEVKIQAMEPDAAGLAFVAGRIDVAVTWEPHLSKAKERRDGRILITTADPMTRGVIVDNLIVRNDVIENRRRDVERLVRAWFRALRFCRTNPEEASAIIAKEFGLTPSETTEMLFSAKPAVSLLGPSANKEFLSLKGDPHTFLEVAGKAADLYHRQRLISNIPDAKALIDTSFLQKVQD